MNVVELIRNKPQLNQKDNLSAIVENVSIGDIWKSLGDGAASVTQLCNYAPLNIYFLNMSS